MSVKTVPEVKSWIRRGLESAAGLTNGSPVDRFMRFRAVAGGPEQNPDRRLVQYAVKGLGFAAFSAFAKVRDSEHTGSPREVVRNSAGLLRLAYLGHLDEQLQYNSNSVYDRALKLPVLNPRLLELKPAIPAVDLSAEFHYDIDRLMLPDRGCPIRGQALELLFQEMVDVIFVE